VQIVFLAMCGVHHGGKETLFCNHAQLNIAPSAVAGKCVMCIARGQSQLNNGCSGNDRAFPRNADVTCVTAFPGNAHVTRM